MCWRPLPVLLFFPTLLWVITTPALLPKILPSSAHPPDSFHLQWSSWSIWSFPLPSLIYWGGAQSLPEASSQTSAAVPYIEGQPTPFQNAGGLCLLCIFNVVEHISHVAVSLPPFVFPPVSDAAAAGDPGKGGWNFLQGSLPPLGWDSPLYSEKDAQSCAQGTHSRHTGLNWVGVGEEEWCLCMWSLTRVKKVVSLHINLLCVGIRSQSELWRSSQDLSAAGGQARGLHLCTVGLWPCRLVGILWFPLGFFSKKYLSFPIHHPPSLFPLPHFPFFFSTPPVPR